MYSMTWLIALGVGISFAVSLLLVPLVRALARAVGMVDHPDGERKLHDEPIALAGGVAVYGAVAATFAALLIIDRASGSEPLLGYLSLQWYVLFAAAGAIMLVGLIDDAWSLRGRQKLLLQCLIVLVLIQSGTIVNQISILGLTLDLGLFAYPITMLWLLLAINALNLLDGADGMATTAGCVISAGLAVLGLQTGSVLCAMVALALSGALLGFLVYNRPPASIFLGDAGSMMIGLFVGVLAVWSAVKESTMLASAPVAILALPLLDSTAAVVRRGLTGRSIYATDRGHLHHLLQAKYGPVGMLWIVAALCLTTTTTAVLAVTLDLPWLAAVGTGLIVAALVLTRSFGHSECRLLLGRGWHFLQSFLVHPHNCDTHRQHHQVRLQGDGKWDTVWEPLVEFAKTHELSKLKIDLSLAWLHEGYHATWQSMRLPEKALQLTVRIPLFARRGDDRLPIGRLEIVAPGGDTGVYERMADLSVKLADLGPEIDAIVTELEQAATQSLRKTPDEPAALPGPRHAPSPNPAPVGARS